jgi:hypothetical protein
MDMQTIIKLLPLLFLIALVIALKKPKSTTSKGFSYAPKRVMTKTEQTLFLRLIDALPEHFILAQVQMSSFLYDTGKKGGWAALNQIRMKSVDFLVIRKDAYIIAAIELQDATHEREDRAESDKFKKEALATANVPLVEFHARNLPSTDEIREKIEKLHATP